MIWFVGSNPSRKNDDRLTPFYGTKSHLTLLSWIAYLGVKNYNFINASNEFFDDGKVKVTNSDLIRLWTALSTERQVVTLGKIASRALNRLHIEHCSLPHPSPRNRLLNNPDLINQELSKCREYLDNIK